MKSNLPIAILVGFLILVTATNAFMSVRYFFSVKEMERLQAHVYQNSRVLNTFEALVNDSLSYSKSNRTILPIIENLESKIKLRTNAPVRAPSLTPSPL